MNSLVEFDIQDALRQYKDEPFTVATPGADAALLDCEHDPESLTSAVVNSVLNGIVDAVAENPEAIGRAEILDSLQFILKCAPVYCLFTHLYQCLSLNLTSSPNADSQPLFQLLR